MIDRRDFMIASLGALSASSLDALADEPLLISSNAVNDPSVPTLRARYAFSVSVFFKERIMIESPRRRAYVPAIGGEIWGPRLTGRVVPYGGADYGSGGLVAQYLFQASDGALIYITNYASILNTDDDGKQVLWSGDAPPTARRKSDESPQQAFVSRPPDLKHQRFRTMPIFDAPVGKHDWLNRTVFVGHGVRHVDPDHSIFTYYEVL